MKLGRYEIVRELGKGAMGIVYLAKDPLIGRLVALKTIRTAAHADDDEAREFQQRFIREAQAAGILNHPAIVTVHDIGQDETTGTSFIAMEYVEGQNLKEILAQNKIPPYEQIAEIMAQVADALDFAHAKGIVHRDVKPANIILVEGARAKITDFGIAKFSAANVNLTTTGQFLGTPNYMAPEQIKGQPVDGRTDLFSLGICLYECLTRRKPFGGDSLTTISYRIVHEDFPPLREINPEIPEGFEDVVGQCLQKDPVKRYQRGRDVATALRAVARGERPVRPPDPVLHEDTVVTRQKAGGDTDRDRVPTIEVPFPEALGAAVAALPVPPPTGAPSPSKKRQSKRTAAAAPTVPATTATPGAQEQPAAAPVPRSRRVTDQFRQTFSDVRAYPVWRTPIAPALFIGITALLLALLVGSMLLIESRKVSPHHVDTKAEAKHARERVVRRAANDAVQRRDWDTAFARFSELQRLAPGSPATATMLQTLGAVRAQQQERKKQLDLARQRFDEGLALYEQKKYADAIPLFEESFHLNPDNDATAQYLKLAQEQQRMVDMMKSQGLSTKNIAPPPRPVLRPRTLETVVGPMSTAPVQFTTVFSGAIADGYIQVKAGGQVVAHENLWQETGGIGRLFRRRTPRPVNVTAEIPPQNSGGVEVWVVIPSLSIQEHHTIARPLPPGSAHRLLVTFDADTKKFDYQLN